MHLIRVKPKLLMIALAASLETIVIQSFGLMRQETLKELLMSVDWLELIRTRLNWPMRKEA